MKTIDLLLTQNVDNLGIVGDVVNVKAGYARNYLVPHGMATVPTRGAIARLAGERERMADEMKVQRTKQEELLARVTDYELTLERSANEQGVLFGGVSQHEIAQALVAAGFAGIDDRAIRIGDQIKRLDSYEIPVVLASDLRTQIKLWIVSDKPSEQHAEEEIEEEVVQADEAPAEDSTEEAVETEADAS